MARTALENAGNHATQPSEQRSDPGTAAPQERERSEESPIPSTVRCRRDADGVTVWVPSEQVDGTPCEDAEA